METNDHSLLNWVKALVVIAAAMLVLQILSMVPHIRTTTKSNDTLQVTFPQLTDWTEEARDRAAETISELRDRAAETISELEDQLP